MKILLNRKPVEGPWGGGNHFLVGMIEECEKRGHTVTHQLEADIDVIYLHDPRPDELGISINEAIQYKRHFNSTLVVHRVNECDARKGTDGVDDLLRQTSQYTDFTIFVSNWMKSYHESLGWLSPSRGVFYNGVNTENFYPREKIDNQKVNIVTHHWSNNYLKGFDVYDWLDKWVEKNTDFTFTYIGRENGSFKNTKVVEPLFGKSLGDELGKYDVYVSASRYDPGPNHVLESLASGIPTYVHVDGGGSVEFAGLDHSYKTLEDLEKILLSKRFEQNSMMPKDWKQCMPDLINQIELKVGYEKNKNLSF